MKLNKFIKEKAKAKKYTMAQLSELCGYTNYTQFSNKICGVRLLSNEDIENLINVLELNKFESYQLHKLNIQDHKGKIKLAVPENANDTDILGILEAVGHVINEEANRKIISILRASEFGMTAVQEDMNDNIDTLDGLIEVTLKMTFMKDYITAKRFLLEAMHIYDTKDLTREIANKVDVIVDFSSEHPELNLLAKGFYERIESDLNNKYAID